LHLVRLLLLHINILDLLEFPFLLDVSLIVLNRYIDLSTSFFIVYGELLMQVKTRAAAAVFRVFYAFGALLVFDLILQDTVSRNALFNSLVRVYYLPQWAFVTAL
jgi:hypothetical protein